MEITILCENSSSDVGCLAEWGFSTFINFQNIKILFDTGYSDVYVHNADKLNLKLQDTNYIIFSHFHSDHTRGLKFYPFSSRKKIICHLQVLEKLPQSESNQWRRDFDLDLSSKVNEFTPNAFFLGEIPRKTSFENGRLDHDPLEDDSALALKTKNGTVVLSGCSHAGICNICEYAKEITNQPLYAVIGGFHLFEKNPIAVHGTLDYFQKEKPTHLFPMHCVDFPTLAKFHSQFGIRKYSAGDIISL